MTLEQPGTREFSPEERQAALSREVAQHVNMGYRVESRTEFQAVMVKGRRPNHLLHFFIGVFTLGLWWLFVWIPVAILAGEKRRVISV